MSVRNFSLSLLLVIVPWLAIVAEAFAEPSSPLSISDVFTSDPARPTMDFPPVQDSPSDAPADVRALSEGGAKILLADALRLAEEKQTAAARNLLGDLVGRLPADSPTAREALVRLAALAADIPEAESHLRALASRGNDTEGGVHAFPRAAAAVAMHWEREAEKVADIESARRLLDLADTLAGARPEAGFLDARSRARVRLSLLARQPQKAIEAIAAAESAGHAATETAEWIALRGRAAYQAGREAQARADFERLVERFPSHAETLDILPRLGLLLELEGESDKARQLYSRYLRESPASERPQWIAARERTLAREPQPYFQGLPR
jgi:tetratricopeptide (TPR) repeat protein